MVKCQIFLYSGAARGRQTFISESVILRQITSDPPLLQTRTDCSAQVAAIGRANALHLNENFIFDFFKKVTLSVSGGEICFVNTEQFWFEHYPTRHKLRSVVLLAFFFKKALEWALWFRSGLEDRFLWFRRQIPVLFQLLPK